METETKPKRRWLRWAGYIAFVAGTFVFFVYQMFPYELLIQRLTNKVQRRAKMRIKIARVKPHWFTGINATDLNIRQLVNKGTAEIQVDQLTLNVSLLSLLTGSVHATFSSLLARGGLQGAVTYNKSAVKAKLQLENIQLSALGPPPASLRKDKQAKPLLTMLFAPVYGSVSADIDVEIPLPGATPKKTKKKAKPKKAKKTKRSRRTRRTIRTRRGRRPRRRIIRRRRKGLDITKATGTIDITIRRFSLGPGYFPTANMGELPVPRLLLGTLKLKLKLEKGRAKIIRCTSDGKDGALKITGYMQLRSRIQYSFFRGRLKFRLNPSFGERLPSNSLLKGALQMLGPTKSSGYHEYKLYLPFRGRPRFRKL